MIASPATDHVLALAKICQSFRCLSISACDGCILSLWSVRFGAGSSVPDKQM